MGGYGWLHRYGVSSFDGAFFVVVCVCGLKGIQKEHHLFERGVPGK